MRLSRRFNEALSFAAELHADQVRKVSGVPYVAHLLGVCSLALEHGANEEQAIAALLHDAVEDQGGRPTLERIRLAFGGSVAGIVEACTDNLDQDGHAAATSWRQRKEAYVAALPHKRRDALLVITADKFYNAVAIAEDVEVRGPGFLHSFAGGPDGVAWYYESLGRTLNEVYASRLATLLGEQCDRIAAAAASENG